MSVLPGPAAGRRTEYILVRELPHYRGHPNEYINLGPIRESEEAAWNDLDGRLPAEWNVQVLRREIEVAEWAQIPEKISGRLENKGSRTHDGITGTVYGPAGKEFPWR